jgi:hypothetical protein
MFSWIAARSVSGNDSLAYNIGLSEWNTSNPDYWGVYYQFFASRWRNHCVLRNPATLDGRQMAWLSGLWLAAYIGVVGFFSNFESFGTLEADAAAPLALLDRFHAHRRAGVGDGQEQRRLVQGRQRPHPALIRVAAADVERVRGDAGCGRPNWSWNTRCTRSSA